MRFSLAVAVICFCSSVFTSDVFMTRALAADASVEKIALWPSVAPGSEGVTANEKRVEYGNVEVPDAWVGYFSKPELIVYHPTNEKRTGTAVVICPGGSYAGLAIDKEGHEVAKWFADRGVVSAVLKYRCGLKEHQHPVPLNDAQRALRIVRSNTEKWQLKTDQIGVMGFSAGGHLASTAGTHHVEGDEKAIDPIDRVSSKANFMVLIYPVISMQDDITHRGSRHNLLGESPSSEMIEEYSNEKQVNAETGPTFLVHTGDDGAVPVENSIRFYQALQKNKVPAALHIYGQGGHGFGMRTKDLPVKNWPAQLEDWLSNRGLLK